jgi:hypothetical protein
MARLDLCVLDGPVGVVGRSSAGAKAGMVDGLCCTRFACVRRVVVGSQTGALEHPPGQSSRTSSSTESATGRRMNAGSGGMSPWQTMARDARGSSSEFEAARRSLVASGRAQRQPAFNTRKQDSLLA